MADCGAAAHAAMDSAGAISRYWQQEWRLPHCPLSIKGYSRAAYRTGFYIPELNIMLDAGPYTVKNPAHIFITHNHVDHVAGLPFSLFCNDKSFRFQVYGPAAAEEHIRRYVGSMFELNDLIPPGEFDPAVEKYQYHGYSEATNFRLTIKKILYEVDVVLCDHTVPTISYCFSEIRRRLKQEYRGKDRAELCGLKAEGLDIMEDFKKRLFGFICDSSIAVLDTNPDILNFPVVFIECTFLYPDEIEQARKCKHIHWADLEPYVQRHPDTFFVLIHFTLRHDEATIMQFFQQVREQTGVSNFKIWVGDTREDLPHQYPSA